MSHQELENVIANIQAMQSTWGETTDLETMRTELEKLYTSYGGVDGAVMESVNANGVAAEFVSAPEVERDRVLLYLHGGGFSVCSAESHRHLAEWISAAAKARVLVIDYRLVPEFRFPAQLEDARSAFQWLLEQGVRPGNICVAGDSAGGGLALALLAALRDQGSSLPACAALISVWADMRCSGASYQQNADIDPVATHEMALGMGAEYVGGKGDLDQPYVSPVNADYTGFPPLLLQVGIRDIFIDDSRAVARNAEGSGVSVRLDEWPGMIHQWHMYAEVLEEGRQAIAEMGTFICEHMGTHC